jgi:hypothetical protein
VATPAEGSKGEMIPTGKEGTGHPFPNGRRIPQKLYKYRPFGIECLSLLTEATVYYSDPRKFNDPLDCAPTVETDADLDALKQLAFRWHVKLAETPSTAEYFKDYEADDDDNEATKMWHRDILRSDIEALLWNSMENKGVLSLSATWKSPLEPLCRSTSRLVH